MPLCEIYCIFNFSWLNIFCMALLPSGRLTLLHFFFLFRAAPVAYGGSQARGPIGATAAAYITATARPDPNRVYKLHRRSRQCRILNPLSKVRDQTRNLMVPDWICFCCATPGTPSFIAFFIPYSKMLDIYLNIY